jgi:hypothetical protein
MDHIYIYTVNEEERNVVFEIHGRDIEGVFSDTMDFDEFGQFLEQFKDSSYAYTINVVDSDREILKEYFKNDILK